LPRTERYLSIGRIVPEKGQDIAIDSALLTDSELDVVGNRYHGPFWASTIRPKIEKSKKIKFHGPVYGERKRALFSRCKALLSPIRWEEPFGLTFVEVLASGAPVIGFAKGATREVVGNCGRFFTSAPDLRRFMNRRPNLSSMEFLSPENCRLQSSKFSYKRMCKEYINFFQNIL
jgi:glycosyltransferase involved in cell wall biosynthesis